MLLVAVSMPYCVNDDAEKYMITLEMLFSSQQEVRVDLHSSKIVHDIHIRSTEVNTHALEIRIQEIARQKKTPTHSEGCSNVVYSGSLLPKFAINILPPSRFYHQHEDSMICQKLSTHLQTTRRHK
jgi:hypothetical protein